jgi:hypothetical protein
MDPNYQNLFKDVHSKIGMLKHQLAQRLQQEQDAAAARGGGSGKGGEGKLMEVRTTAHY